MAADKEIMKAIEHLRLDRPGRVHESALSVDVPDAGLTLGMQLIAGLTELAATYREEAELWSRSGAKGWKSSETEKYLVAQHIDDVAAQLDNAGGGAALSVSEPERKTAHEWNDDPRVDPYVVSWSDFGSSAHALGMTFGENDPITLAEFERARDGGAVTVGRRPAATTHERLDDFVSSAAAAGKGTLRDETSMRANPPLDLGVVDVTAYLKGEIDTLPGLAEALVPGSVSSPPEIGNPFEPRGGSSLVGQLDENLQPVAPYCARCDLDQHRCPGCGEPVDHNEVACAQCNLLHAEPNPPIPTGPEVAARTEEIRAIGAALPKTWESDTLTADGHMKPGVAQTLAPTLGQPGDMGTGYSHTYVPAGGRKVTYAELLTPVPAASLPPHLSHSQANAVGDCATKYRLQRVEQLPQIPQWANIGGTAFHAAVEQLERMIAKTPVLRFDSIDVELNWKHHFEGQITAVAMTTPVPQSVWRAARKGAEGEQWWRVNGPLMLRRYLDARPAEHTANLPNLSAGGTLGPDMFQSAIELEITADVPTPYGPIPFTAKLDRVTNAPQAEGDNWITLVIRDYKTSYERPTDTTQLGDYANALRLWGVPESVRILGTYFDARRGEWTEPVDLLQAHPFEAFQYRVTTAHAQKRALTTGPTPARPSSYCGGCAVRYACPVMAAKS